MKTKTISIPKEVFEKTFQNYAQQGPTGQNNWYNKNPPAFMLPNRPNQFGQYIDKSVPQNIGYAPTLDDGMPDTGFNIDYQKPNLPPIYNQNVPQNIGYNFNPAQSFSEYNQGQVATTPAPKYQDTNRVNITTSEFGNPTANLNRAFYNFGAGDKAGGALSLGAGILGTLREGINSYSTGKEDKRVAGGYAKKLFERNPAYQYAQQGELEEEGIRGNPNVIAEKGELKINPDGSITEINHGTKHVEDGKAQPGSPIHAEQGSQIVTNSKMPTQRVTPEDRKLVKDAFGIAVKGKTHAEIVKELIKPVSTKKIDKELADLTEKLGKATSIKDRVTAALSSNAIQKNIAKLEERKKTLQDEQYERADFVYKNIQEVKPKIGNPGDLFDDRGNKVTQQANVAQQGNSRIEELARKHGISVERANQLIAMQQGGEEQQPQEDPMQQIFQAVEHMLQGGASPEEVAQQLVEMGVPEDQVGPIIEQVMGGGAEQQPQVAQQNGYNVSTRINPKKTGYKSTENSVLDKDNLEIEDWQSFREGAGYGKSVADVNKFMNTHKWYFNSPEKIEAFKQAALKKGEQPEVAAFQEKYNKEVENKLKQAGFTDQEIADTVKKVGFSKEGLQKVDGLFGGFTSTRPMVDFEKEEASPETDVALTAASQAEGVIPRDNVKSYLYQKNPFLAPNFALNPIAKNDYNPNLYDFRESGIEPFLQNQARSAMTRQDQLEQTGMSANAIAALSGSDYANNQYAANDAISRTQMSNVDNRMKVDMANTDTLNRASLVKNSINDAYAQKVYGSIANKEADIYNRALTDYKRGEQEKMEALAMNYANAKNDQFAVTPYGIEFLNNKPYEMKTDYEKNKNLTPAEELARKRNALKARQTFGLA